MIKVQTTPRASPRVAFAVPPREVLPIIPLRMPQSALCRRGQSVTSQRTPNPNLHALNVAAGCAQEPQETRSVNAAPRLRRTGSPPTQTTPPLVLRGVPRLELCLGDSRGS